MAYHRGSRNLAICSRENLGNPPEVLEVGFSSPTHTPAQMTDSNYRNKDAFPPAFLNSDAFKSQRNAAECPTKGCWGLLAVIPLALSHVWSEGLCWGLASHPNKSHTFKSRFGLWLCSNHITSKKGKASKKSAMEERHNFKLPWFRTMYHYVQRNFHIVCGDDDDSGGDPGHHVLHMCRKR